MIPEPSSNVRLEKDDTYRPEIWVSGRMSCSNLGLKLF